MWVYFQEICITFKSYLPFWAYWKMPVIVAQNDDPMADNEKITEIGAAYYVKVVDASFPHFSWNIKSAFLRSYKLSYLCIFIRDQDQRQAQQKLKLLRNIKTFHPMNPKWTIVCVRVCVPGPAHWWLF